MTVSAIDRDETEAFELRAGALRLALRPDLGGSIAGLWHHGVPVMRSMEPDQLARASRAACFALVPYANRIARGRFSWQGRPYQLALDGEGGPHPLDGVGYLSRWEFAPPGGPSGPAEIALTLDHRADEGWPFPFRARQLFQLSPTSLRVELSVTNSAAQAAPVGLGWRCSFPRRTRSRLHVECSGRWELDPLMLPTQLVPQPGVDADLAHLDYDHCFEGWAGPARLRDERFALTLRSSLSRLVICTPQGEDYFAVEPVSHVSNAINQPAPSALGLVTLQPGQSHHSWIVLDVQPTH
jgi:aldose 1-epimerase